MSESEPSELKRIGDPGKDITQLLEKLDEELAEFGLGTPEFPTLLAILRDTLQTCCEIIHLPGIKPADKISAAKLIVKAIDDVRKNSTPAKRGRPKKSVNLDITMTASDLDKHEAYLRSINALEE